MDNDRHICRYIYFMGRTYTNKHIVAAPPCSCKTIMDADGNLPMESATYAGVGFLDLVLLCLFARR